MRCPFSQDQRPLSLGTFRSHKSHMKGGSSRMLLRTWSGGVRMFGISCSSCSILSSIVTHRRQLPQTHRGGLRASTGVQPYCPRSSSWRGRACWYTCRVQCSRGVEASSSSMSMSASVSDVAVDTEESERAAALWYFSLPCCRSYSTRTGPRHDGQDAVPLVAWLVARARSQHLAQ